ncbi:hypothetical protein HMSSN036_18610 [Paenibacillus macerans]|nr:hypothetical protein HMSSN036_18610 [Paenibacillus macerans]
MNKKIRFNDGWEFAKSGLETASPGELSFEPVDIPHDWLIYNTLDLYETASAGIGKRSRIQAAMSRYCWPSTGFTWTLLCM